MTEAGEILGGTSGAQSASVISPLPYSDEEWQSVSVALPKGAPADARIVLERAIHEFLDMPSLPELRELYGGYIEDVRLVDAALRSLLVAVDSCSLNVFRELVPHLRAASEVAQKTTEGLKRDAPRPKDKYGEAWPHYMSRLCAMWHKWTGEIPRFGRPDGVYEKPIARGPVIDFLVAAAAPTRRLRQPWNKKAMTPEMAAKAITSYRKHHRQP